MRRGDRRRSCVLATLVVTCACASFSDPGDRSRPAIVIDHDRIVLRKEGSGRGALLRGSLDYSFTNRTEDVVYLPLNEGPFLEKLMDEEWVRSYGNAHPVPYGPPRAIRPGETVSREYPINHGLPQSSFVRQFHDLEPAEIPGAYRMVWEIYREVDERGFPSGLIPLEHRISKVFTIELEEGVLESLEPPIR